MTEGVAPSTGNTSFGGTSGKMQRRQGVSAGWTDERRPSMPQMLLYTRGIFFRSAHSIEKKTCRGIIHAVENDVGVADEPVHVLFNDLVRERTNGYIRVEPLQLNLAGYSLARANPRMAVQEDLTVTGVPVRRIKITDSDIPDAGRREINRYR